MRRKNIMIFGGEFYNKGAQAMSFITISRLKSHFPDHNILFISELDSKRTPEELENYNFDIIANPFDRNNFFGENFIRSILGKSQKDRKSTRLNSSHVAISYAVFCLIQ